MVPRSSAAALASSRNLLEHRISGLSPDLLNKNLHLNKSLRPLFLVAQMVKNPPTTCENWVRSLGWEDALEEGTTTHSYSRLENPHGQRSLVGYSSWGHKESGTTERLSTEQGRACGRDNSLSVAATVSEYQLNRGVVKIKRWFWCQEIENL